MRAVVPAVVWLATCSVALAAGELIAQGDAYDRQFKTAEALETYLRAEREQPDDAALLRKISKQYVEMVIDARSKAEKTRLAQKGYDYALRAKALAPDDAETRLTVAVAAGRLAFFKGPRERIELSQVIRDESSAAMKIAPGYALAWHIQGRWHYEIANLNPLLKIIAETVYGKMPPATLDAAVEHLERAAELDPGNALFRAELGRALLASGRRAEARRELEKSLTLPRRVRDDAAAQERAKQALGTF